MCHSKTLLLAGCLGLFAFVPLAPLAAQFHETYGRGGQIGELTSVSSTGMREAIASGSFDDQGVLLKVQPTGSLAWVQSYGPTQISAVREAGAGFAWIGTARMAQTQGFAPVVAGVDSVGKVLWAQRIELALPDGTPADRAFGRFLEVDPKDGGYWMGGDAWFHTDDEILAWLGKLDSTGKLLWVKTLSFSSNIRFLSIFPALRGGIVGVGQIWPKDNYNRDRARMLAVKLGDSGDLVWGFDYGLLNVGHKGEQRLSDLDRDPRSTWPQSFVVGTVAGFCKSIPSVPCDPVESAAFVASLNEDDGILRDTYGLLSTSQPKTFGETIVADLPAEVVAVGGEVEEAGLRGRRGFLALLPPGFDLVRKASFHGAGGGYTAEVRSLDRWRDAIDHGYLFAMHEEFTAPRPKMLRSLVLTNRDGNSGSCEECARLKTIQAYLDSKEVPLALRAGTVEPFEVQGTQFKLAEEPCGARACGEN